MKAISRNILTFIQRLKRALCQFEIGEPPGEQTQNNSSSTDGGNSTLGIEQMEAAQATVVNKFQSGAADEELGVQVEAVSVSG